MKYLIKPHICLSVTDNVKVLGDGGFYTQRTFKTAIAKPVLYAVRFTEIINNKILKKWNLLKNTTGQMNRD